VRGKIDRIDILPPTTPDTSNKLQLQIIDYKTGKKPWLKYSHKVNKRIEKEQFWKMKVYCKYYSFHNYLLPEYIETRALTYLTLETIRFGFMEDDPAHR
jgi:hypothetical protein